MADQKQTVHSVQDLFAAALDVPPERRSAFLKAACHDGPTLDLLAELLAEHDRAGSFLRNSPFTPSSGTDPTLSETPGGSAGYTDAPPRFYPGQVIDGRFAIERFIDRGGMGEVYAVRDQELQGARKALKVIRPEIASDPRNCERFHQEIMLAQKIHHSNLCPIYHISRCAEPAPPFFYLIMKLLEGETLYARLRSSRPPTAAEATDICLQLIRGVGAIHDGGVIHRDLKPNNIMLERHTGKLCVYIMDFGLARLHEAEHSVAGTGIAGTPGYIAPELFAGGHPGEATDIFALGVVMHMTLTGERPIPDTRTLGVKPAPSLHASSAPPYLISATEDFLSNDPDQRTRAFHDLHEAIESHQPPPVRSHTFMTRRRFGMLAGASTCVLAGGAAWRREQIYDWTHPLPRKRFVAVLNWPPTKDPKIRGVINGLLDSIANELSRAEAYDHNFFVTTSPPSADVNAPKDLLATTEALGANLVLGASATTIGKRLLIVLQVLDPSTPRTLRSRDLRATMDQVFSIPQHAVHIAAELLGVSRYQPDELPNTAGTNNGQALAAFQQAELLRKQDNDAGLQQAIDKYKEATDLDPRYAQAQAQLGWAYLRLYGIHSQRGALLLSIDNFRSAIAVDPNLVQAHSGLSWALEQSGDRENASREMAKALSLDPSNPQTLLYQSHNFYYEQRFEAAAESLARVVQLRPNYWVVRNDLGVLLDDQARYADALAQFRSASLTAPKSALAFSNMGSVYLEMGRLDEAVQSFQHSLALAPSDDAAAGLASAFRILRRYADAVGEAQTATKLNPDETVDWLTLGDCCSAARRPEPDVRAAYTRALEAAEEGVRAEPKKGRNWMLLAMLRVKNGRPAVDELISKAESFGASDMTSRLFKIRTLELLGKRDDALEETAKCLTRGATVIQFQTMPDLDKMRSDPRYLQLIQRVNSSAENSA